MSINPYRPQGSYTHGAELFLGETTMALQHSNTADAWTPADYGKLVNLAVQAKSIAFHATTAHQTDKVKVNFPLWVSDPAVAWYNELDTIAATDGATGEVVCTPAKTAG